MKLFSDNIIFLDTEFSSLDPYRGEILSVGLVKLEGEELYLELEYDGEYDEWTKKNILPTLKGPKVSRGEARKKIRDFIGDKKPFMVSYVNTYDAAYWYKLFGANEPFSADNPCYWIPIDFASILFALGVDPNSYHEDKTGFYKKLGIDFSEYKQHNALEDARLLRNVYLKFFEKK